MNWKEEGWGRNCHCGNVIKRWSAKHCSTACHQAAKAPLAERFWARVDKNGPTMPHMPTPCWMWTGARDERGYGRIGLGTREEKTALTSRVSFELNIGPLPEGMCALHHCDNPPCVNPGHLFMGTRIDNNADMKAKGRHRHGSRWASRKAGGA